MNGNTQITPEELKKRFTEAPDSVKEILLSEKLLTITNDLGEKYELTEAGVEVLQDIIGSIVLELIPRMNLEKELAIFELTPREMEDFVTDLDKTIFNPLRRDPSSLKDPEFNMPEKAVEPSPEGKSIDHDTSENPTDDIEKPIDRDALLAEIEDKEDVSKTEEVATSQSPEEQDFVSKKMAGGGGLPRTESRFDDEDSGKSERKPSEQDSGYDVDPYREPIE